MENKILKHEQVLEIVKGDIFFKRVRSFHRFVFLAGKENKCDEKFTNQLK